MEKRKEILPAGRGMKDVQVLILTPSMAATHAPATGAPPGHAPDPGGNGLRATPPQR